VCLGQEELEGTRDGELWDVQHARIPRSLVLPATFSSEERKALGNSFSFQHPKTTALEMIQSEEKEAGQSKLLWLVQKNARDPSDCQFSLQMAELWVPLCM
jgi:hypothetical protein